MSKIRQRKKSFSWKLISTQKVKEGENVGWSWSEVVKAHWPNRGRGKRAHPWYLHPHTWPYLSRTRLSLNKLKKGLESLFFNPALAVLFPVIFGEWSLLKLSKTFVTIPFVLFSVLRYGTISCRFGIWIERVILGGYIGEINDQLWA